MINYNLNGDINNLNLKNVKVEVLKKEGNDFSRPIKYKHIAVQESSPLNYANLIKRTPKNIRIENFKVNFDYHDLTGKIKLDFESIKENGQIKSTTKIKGFISIAKFKIHNLNYEATIQSTLNKDNLNVQNSSISFLLESPIKYQEKFELELSSMIFNDVSFQLSLLDKSLSSVNLNISPIIGKMNNIKDAITFNTDTIFFSSNKIFPFEINKTNFKILMGPTDLDLVSKKISFNKISAELVGNVNDLSYKLDVDKVISHIKDNDKDYITPLKVNVHGTKKNSDLQLKIVTQMKQQKSLKVSTYLKYDLDKEIGDISFKLPSLSLSPGSFSLKNVSPFASNEKVQTDGKISLNAHVPLNKHLLKGLLSLDIKDLSLKYNQIELSYLTTKLNIHNLNNPRTKARQKVKINRIKLGQIIENILFEWQLNSKKIELVNVTGDILGGNASIENINLDIEKNKFKPFLISFKNLDLFKVLSIGLDKGLTADGRIDGQIEVRINKKGIPYVKGSFKTTNSGTIKYDNQTVDQMGNKAKTTAGLLVHYMKNMKYKNLEISLESDDNYDLKVVLNLFGNNPDLSKNKDLVIDLDDRPLKLKLNLELNLMKAIKSYFLAVKLPERLEEKLINSLNFK